MNRFCYLLLSLVCLYLFAIQNANSQQFKVIEFDKRYGFNKIGIGSIARDSIGFMWVASDSGLFRFDGDRFEPYKNGIGSSKVRSLVAMSQTGLVFSREDGVYRIQCHPDTVLIDKLLATHAEITDSTLLDPHELYPSRDGSLWISESGSTIVRYSDGMMTRFDLGIGHATENLVSTIVFAEDVRDNLWIASHPGFVFRFDQEQNTFIQMFDADRLGFINHLIPTADGNLLLLGDRIYEARINHNGFLDNLIPLATLPSPINHAIQGPEGKFYFGTNMGLYRARYENKFTDFEVVFNHTDAHRVENFPFQVIRELAFADGNIWLSTDTGLGLMKVNFFESVENLPMQHIYALNQVGPENIYASFGELFQITPESSGSQLKSMLGKEGGFIMAVDGSEDSLWAGNVDGELFLFNRGKIRKKYNLNYRGGGIFYLLMDRSADLWVCQAPTDKPLLGIAKLTSAGKWVFYGPEQGLDQRILVVRESPQGVLFAAGIGEDSYLFRYDEAADGFVNLSLPLPFVNPRFEVHDLAVDLQGIVWLGTTDGLLRCNSEQVERVDLEEFTEVEIRAVVVAGDSSIWASTDIAGVLRYQDGQVVVFNESSGLPSKITSYRTLTSDFRNRIWVGTAEGLVPSQKPNPKPPKTPTPLLELQVDGRKLGRRYMASFTNQSVLKFNYTVLAYPSLGMEFSTRLNSREEHGEWNNQGNQKETLMAGLALGDYEFAVRARQTGGYEWSDSISYPFSIRSVWYQTYWAYGGFGLIGVLFLWTFTRAVTYKLRKEKFELQSILKQKTNPVQSNKESGLKRLRNFTKALDQLNKNPGWTTKTTTIFEELAKFKPIDSFGIGIKDLHSGEIQAQEIVGSDHHQKRRTITISGTQNFPVECLSNGKTVWIKNLSELGPEETRKLEFKEDQSMNSLVYLPLKLNNKTIGYLTIKSRQKNAFDNFDIQTFRVLASIVAMNRGGR